MIGTIADFPGNTSGLLRDTELGGDVYQINPIPCHAISGLLKKSKQTAVCFPLKFPGVRVPPRFLYNSSFQVNIAKNQHIVMQGVKALKEIERWLARFSLKVRYKSSAYNSVFSLR